MSKFYTHVAVRGSKILYRGYENGKRIKRAEVFNPVLFVPSRKPKTEWTTLDGRPVEPFRPGDINDCREFIDQYKGTQGFEIFGNTDWQYQFIGERFPDEVEYDADTMNIAYIDIETESEEGFPNIASANERINVITVKVKDQATVFALGKATVEDGNIQLRCYDNESRMLQDFVEFWESSDLDIVTGWNVNFFDIPYIVNRVTRVLGEDEAKRLSPWKQIKSRKVEVNGNENEVYDLVGIAVLDYYDLYRKFTYVTQESYRLDHIAFVELGQRKLHYDGTITDFYRRDFQRFVEYNIKDVDLVRRLEDKLKLLELALALAYSAKVNLPDVFSQVRTWDTIIYHELNSRCVVVPPRKTSDKGDKFEGAYVKDPLVGKHDWVVSFDLDSLYPHLIMQYNISPETKVSNKHRGVYSVEEFLAHGGAYTRTGAPAPTRTPTRSRAGVDEFLENMKIKDLAVPANGVVFRKDQKGFLNDLMERMYLERKTFKGKMLDAKRRLKELKDGSPEEIRRVKNEISKYHNFQQVRKIQLNSAYGAIGNEYFRYFDIDIAEAITVSGQLSIRWIEGHLNRFLNKTLGTEGTDYIIASDTDSVYIRLGQLVSKVLPNETDDGKITTVLNKFCNEIIQPFIERKYEALAEQQNAYSQKMNMKRESIASKGIWTAKKRYMLNVKMGEESVLLTKPELKIMGIETARSSTPQVVRDALKESIWIIMNESEEALQRFVSTFKDRFMEMSVSEIAFPRGCKGLENYADRTKIYRKSTPIAVKGALIYNHWLGEKKLKKIYPSINDGEKVKFVYLRIPNPLREHVVSFSSEIPEEFGLTRQYIDYETQFDKAYMEPLKTILNAIGWKAEETNSLESLFS